MKYKHKLAVIVLLFSYTALAAVGSATGGGTMTVSHSPTVSKGDNPEMTKIFYEVEINASKAKAWEVLADFANVSWTDTVTDAHYINDKRADVGMARYCNLQDGGHIVERITQWDKGSGFTYVIDEASDPITTDSYVVWHITGDDSRSKVSFEVQYELKYGFIGDIMNALFAKDKFSKQIAHFMAEYKAHVESQS